MRRRGQRPQASSSLYPVTFWLGMRCSKVHAVEPAQTLIMGSPEHVPTRATHEPASAVPVQPSTTAVPGLQVYEVARLHPQVALRPSEVAPEAQGVVGLVPPEPASIVLEQALAERVHPMPKGQARGSVAPELLPGMHCPTLEHHPQRVSATQVEHPESDAQLTAHGPQSCEQLIQVSVPLHEPSPQRAAH